MPWDGFIFLYLLKRAKERKKNCIPFFQSVNKQKKEKKYIGIQLHLSYTHNNKRKRNRKKERNVEK